VGKQIVQALGEILGRGMADPRIGLVTITAADVSDDLRNAKVYYSVIGEEESRHQARQGLKAASGYLRREVAQALSLRYAPQLRFEFDETLARAARIASLIEVGLPDAEADSGPDPEGEGGDDGQA
jgi:ribosome-binding factor A